MPGKDTKRGKKQGGVKRPPAPKTEDQLSPGKILRDNRLSSRSERLGNNTPTGPATTPPVDPDAV